MEGKAVKDAAGEDTWRAVCVSGDDNECGVDSGEMGGEGAVVKWMTVHAATTSHTRFKRSFSDYAILELK
ncbi:hypothetical protein ACIREH_09720 [Streptomyces ardesiacus]|uniref:hypothetical protein n=1 Tax=Streptomyces ardesiacus TaxID=285564 RepID=UPI0038036E0E